MHNFNFLKDTSGRALLLLAASLGLLLVASTVSSVTPADADSTYLEKAQNVYAWQKTLTNDTGKVFDSISYNKTRQTMRLSRGPLTYKKGTYIRAAVLLYLQTKDKTYLDDAIKTAQRTEDNLCVTDQRVLRNEGQGDAGIKGDFRPLHETFNQRRWPHRVSAMDEGQRRRGMGEPPAGGQRYEQQLDEDAGREGPESDGSQPGRRGCLLC